MQDSVPTWVGATAKQIARAVRRGDTTATQVMADHLDHVATAEPIVAAFRSVRGGVAIVEAEKVDEQEDELGNLPLAGVPVAVKENTAVAGLPTWRGSAAASAEVAEEDHEIVRRLRGAGAVVIGTTKMPELGLWGTTDDDTGPTRNPWRTDRTPGGSSGGAAAAVASGMVPIAHGNDGMGSIRIPAACCGLVGLKPGRGVIPCDLDTDWFGLTEHGVLATTVADAAVGFAVLAGRRPDRLVPPDRLRIGVSTRSPLPGVWPDRPNRDAVAAAARLLTVLGHDAVVAEPTYPTSLGLRGLATWFAGAAEAVQSEGVDRGALQPRSRRHAALGEWALRRGYVREADREAWRERSIAFFADKGVDLLLLPALAGAPPRADGWAGRSWAANMLVCMRYAPYSAAWNIAGLPAIAVPVGVRPDGLPLAVQVVGPPGSELLLLAVAGQFEMRAPWRRHAPTWPRVAKPAA